jgi:hypothetical protein
MLRGTALSPAGLQKLDLAAPHRPILYIHATHEE